MWSDWLLAPQPARVGAAVFVLLVTSSSAMAGEAQSEDARRAEALAEFRTVAQQCRTAPTQEVGVELEQRPGRPVSEPATPEEQTRVKEILTASGLEYDPKNHRATYEFTLVMIRARTGVVFSVKSSEPGIDLSVVRTCLVKLSTEAGLEYRFEE